MHGSCAVLFNFGECLFFDRRNNDVVTLGTRSIEDKKWKLSVPRNQPQSLFRGIHLLESLASTQREHPHVAARS